MRRTAPILLILVALAACGASRDSILSRTAVGLDAARAAFTVEDERQQLALVAAANTEGEARQAVAAHRKNRDAGTKAFQVAYGALASAALDPSDHNMARLAELAGLAVAALKGGAP